MTKVTTADIKPVEEPKLWTQGDWKWVSFTASDGPVPTNGTQVISNGQTLQNAVSQFGGLRYAR